MKRAIELSSKRGTLFFLFLSLGFLFVCQPTYAQGQASSMDALSEEVGRIFRATEPSVVRINVMAGPAHGECIRGTGFFIDSEGTILTSAALVGQGFKVLVEYQGHSIPAAVVGADVRSGIALLRIEAHATPALKLGDSDKSQVAQSVIGIGYPYNLPAAPAVGTLAGFDVQYLERFFATTHMRVNMPISTGQLGGPLLNSKGEAIGLLVMAVDDGKGCYAIPSKAVQRIAQDILKYGQAQHGWVGVGVTQSQDPQAPQGGRKIVRISHLFPNTAAEKSGLQAGDELLKIGDHEIHQPSDILDAAFYSKIGENLAVRVIREGKPLIFTLEVQPRPTQLH